MEEFTVFKSGYDYQQGYFCEAVATGCTLQDAISACKSKELNFVRSDQFGAVRDRFMQLQYREDKACQQDLAEATDSEEKYHNQRHGDVFVCQ